MRPRTQRCTWCEAPRSGSIRRCRPDRGAIVIDRDRGIRLGTRTRQRRGRIVGHAAVADAAEDRTDIIGNIADGRRGGRRSVDGDRIGGRLCAAIACGVGRRDGEAVRPCAQRRRRREAPGPDTVSGCRPDRSAIVVDGDRGIRLGTRTRQRRGGIIGETAVAHAAQDSADIVGDIADRRNRRCQGIDHSAGGRRDIANGIGRCGDHRRAIRNRTGRRIAPVAGAVRGDGGINVAITVEIEPDGRACLGRAGQQVSTAGVDRRGRWRKAIDHRAGRRRDIADGISCRCRHRRAVGNGCRGRIAPVSCPVCRHRGIDIAVIVEIQANRRTGLRRAADHSSVGWIDDGRGWCRSIDDDGRWWRDIAGGICCRHPHRHTICKRGGRCEGPIPRRVSCRRPVDTSVAIHVDANGSASLGRARQYPAIGRRNGRRTRGRRVGRRGVGVGVSSAATATSSGRHASADK